LRPVPRPARGRRRPGRRRRPDHLRHDAGHQPPRGAGLRRRESQQGGFHLSLFRGRSAARPAVRRLYWWREVLTVVVLYEIYSAIRNLSEGSKAQAFRHARGIRHWQQMAGLNPEATLQWWALPSTRWTVSLNNFSGCLTLLVPP